MLEENLQKHFQYENFRPGQKEVVKAIIDGKDVVALMPTGGGKSLCYQLPAVMKEGMTVVISPLIALMKDQVDALKARGIEATFLNSSLKSDEIEKRKQTIVEGKIKLLYLAPERLNLPNFFEFFSQLPISFLAVDEAHCVSEWGHDFRSDYLAIKGIVEKMKERPILGAFTATATPEVKKDIVARLGMKEPEVFVRGFDRANLKFFAEKNLKPKEKMAEILRLVRSLKGSGIVYALTRKETENLALFLRENDINAVAYHAGMEGRRREQVQDQFMNNEFKVIVATIAFGMGVDKADVRFVIHAGMPKNLESYYQEAGRAGRDGETAYCILLHGKKDVSTHRFFFRKDAWSMLDVGKSEQEVDGLMRIKENRLQQMINYATNSVCRRKTILDYFGDPESRHLENGCEGCDVCMGWERKEKQVMVELELKKQTAQKGREDLTTTVMETVNFHKKGYSPDKIAKIRGLSEETIFNHLIKWYLAGGNFELENFITPSEEKEILQAMARTKNYQFLGAIKETLPTEISYAKIKMVIAKIKRIKID